MKVIGQGHQDQGHYLKKRSVVNVIKVKVRVQGHKHKVNVAVRNKGQRSRSPRSILKVNVIGKCHKEQIQLCLVEFPPPSTRGRFDKRAFLLVDKIFFEANSLFILENVLS